LAIEVELPQLEGEVDQFVIAVLQVVDVAASGMPGDDFQRHHVGQWFIAQRFELGDHFLGLDDPLGLDRIPVGVVVPGALHEVLDATGDLGGVRYADRRQVEPSVDDANVDAHRRRHDVVTTVVRTERGEGVLDQADVERRHDRRQVDRVAEPEHRFVVVLALLAEQQVVRVEVLPALGPGRRGDGKRAVETVLAHEVPPVVDVLNT